MPELAGTNIDKPFEHRLNSLELQGVESRNRLIHVERTVDAVGRQVSELDGKMDQVISAVTTVQAQPKIDFGKMLDLATKCVVIFVATAAGITYIASNINAVQNAENKAKYEFLQQRLDRGWFTTSKMEIRSPGGAVTPQ
jgi:hypothetical protein